MAENNGQNGESRLDRIERAIEHIVGEHETFREEHNRLLRSQVLLQEAQKELQEAQKKQEKSLERLEVQVAEIGGKLDALIHIVERDHSEFHQRLTRLEGLQ
jgi:hypothetical protein